MIKNMHRNKPNLMSDSEIMGILILFHSGGFCCFNHYYKEYGLCTSNTFFRANFPNNRFVGLKRTFCFP